MQCSTCHALLELDAQYCSSCGSSVPHAATGSTQRLDQAELKRIATTLRGGLCPQCTSTEVFVKTDALIAGLDSHPVILSVASQMQMVSMMPSPIPMRTAPINVFLCAECGYLELYLADGSVLERVKKTWARAVAAEPQT